ncbi:hypothetical protein CEQ90_19875 [Lewinellaceae bacterium SD302]|nr:hypothetical protein CEQ90_19875 [Lewinellaceae bacterium SD302]
MKNKNLLILVFLSLAMILILVISYNLSNKKEIVAATIINENLNSNRHIVYLGPGMLNKDSVYITSSFVHENMHTYKNVGAVHIDVPTAASVGLYYEFFYKRDLYDEKLKKSFYLGYEEKFYNELIYKVFMPYIKVNASETYDTYKDGAIIAGVAYKLSRGVDFYVGYNYIMGLSYGLNPYLAEKVCKDEDAMDFVRYFCRGHYIQYNYQYMSSEMVQMNDTSEAIVEEFLEYVDDTYYPNVKLYKGDLQITRRDSKLFLDWYRKNYKD